MIMCFLIECSTLGLAIHGSSYPTLHLGLRLVHVAEILRAVWATQIPFISARRGASLEWLGEGCSWSAGLKDALHLLCVRDGDTAERTQIRKGALHGPAPSSCHGG